MYLIDSYDVIVVGAGHAGCEAALAAARMGCKTLLTTISLDNVAMMPCNPAVGGPGKSHLVKELDALGGEMGIAADATAIQMRMLNSSKGPAVYALRAQSDKGAYHRYMKKVIENTDNLDLKQMMVVDILEEDGHVNGIISELGEAYTAKAVILCTGTYLESDIIIGDNKYKGGPNGMRPSTGLSENLRKHGIELLRFKTGHQAVSTCVLCTWTTWRWRKAIRSIIPSPSWMKMWTETRRSAGSPIPTKPPIRLSGTILREHRSIPVLSPGSEPDTARPLKIR